MQQSARHSQSMSEALKNKSIDQSEDTESISASMHEMTATAQEVANTANEGMQLATLAVGEIEQTVGEIQLNLSLRSQNDCRYIRVIRRPGLMFEKVKSHNRDFLLLTNGTYRQRN